MQFSSIKNPEFSKELSIKVLFEESWRKNPEFSKELSLKVLFEESWRKNPFKFKLQLF